MTSDRISMKNNPEKIDMVYKNNFAWHKLDDTIKIGRFSQVFILCDTNTLVHCLPYFLHKQNFIYPPKILTFPHGEKHKNIFTCTDLWHKLSEEGAERNSLIINLGGGVVTDLGGFVASTYQRGVSFINIPTSLLAMVDAAVGGKTGVDLGALKNQIGLINNPKMVIIDFEFLKTLPQNHLFSGIAEILKHGLISGNNYWERVRNLDLQDPAAFENIIWESIDIKQKIVLQDPFENNLRKTLNYGHTLGHAIESFFLEDKNKKTLLHGEAIGIGLILETFISYKLFNFPMSSLDILAKTILRYFKKVKFQEKDIEQILYLLQFDKKNRNGEVLFVLLKNIGSYSIDNTVRRDLIISAFDYYKKL